MLQQQLHISHISRFYLHISISYFVHYCSAIFVAIRGCDLFAILVYTHMLFLTYLESFLTQINVFIDLDIINFSNVLKLPISYKRYDQIHDAKLWHMKY
jgi:hypothetical protein